MKVVILAGGHGTRISEESYIRPKPMVEIGGKPILWHIMKIFSSYGYNEFIICAGYKQQVIKEYFANYFLQNSDITFDFIHNGEMIIHHKDVEQWKVTIVDTGLNTMTGGRIKRIKKYLDNERFFLTYGDAVADIDLNKLLDSHLKSNKLCTMSVYNYKQSKGVPEIDDEGNIIAFREKSNNDSALINIGFMVLEPKVLEYIENDETIFECDPLNNLAIDKQLTSYHHHGFWQCMDTMNEKNKLEEIWNKNEAPWKIWR